MKFEIFYDEEGVFIDRKNRFLGVVDIGKKELVHIHDPGRLEELLYPGNKVLIKKADSSKRKTKWDLIAAQAPEDRSWVLVHSGYHRPASEHILKDIFPNDEIKAEVKLGKSRIDFIVNADRKIAVEVKGCTLAKNKIALFPDAPTTRGRRHVEELIKFKKDGNEAILLVLVFRDARCFLPNESTDPDFARTFWKAIMEGVKIMPIRLKYDAPTLKTISEIPLCPRYHRE